MINYTAWFVRTIFVCKQLTLYQAKDRLNEKRTYFGREALKIVSSFFGTEKYAGHPDKIATYAAWATKSNGPSIWGIPTPIGCVVSEDHPAYVVR